MAITCYKILLSDQVTIMENKNKNKKNPTTRIQLTGKKGRMAILWAFSCVCHRWLLSFTWSQIVYGLYFKTYHYPLHWSLMYTVLGPGLDQQVNLINKLGRSMLMSRSCRTEGGVGMGNYSFTLSPLVLLSLRETGKEKAAMQLIRTGRSLQADIISSFWKSRPKGQEGGHLGKTILYCLFHAVDIYDFDLSITPLTSYFGKLYLLQWIQAQWDHQWSGHPRKVNRMMTSGD